VQKYVQIFSTYTQAYMVNFSTKVDDMDIYHAFYCRHYNNAIHFGYIVKSSDSINEI